MAKITARAAGVFVIVCAAGCQMADTTNTPVPSGSSAVITRITAAPSAHLFTALGQSQQILATALDQSGTVVRGTRFTWMSTAPGIVSVDTMGRMTARTVGTAAIVVGAACCVYISDTVNAAVQVLPPVSGGAPLFSDGFETGNLSHTAGGVAWTGGSRTAVTNERAYSGTHSLRFRYQAAPNGSDSHSEQRFRLPNIVPEIWLEWMLYVPQNFEIRKQDHFENNKIFSLWAADYNTNRLIDTELTMEYFRQTDTDGMSRLSVAHGDANASTGRNDHERNDYQGLLFTAANRGTWIRVRVYAKLDRAGVVRMWRDNELVYELKNWNLWGTGGINRFESGYLMGWANSGFTQQTDFYVDDVKIYNSNPGWQ